MTSAITSKGTSPIDTGAAGAGQVDGAAQIEGATTLGQMKATAGDGGNAPAAGGDMGNRAAAFTDTLKLTVDDLAGPAAGLADRLSQAKTAGQAGPAPQTALPGGSDAFLAKRDL